LERNLDKVWRVADTAGFEEEDVGITIWAFCLITSAGVRIAQEHISAIEDAAELMTN